MSAFRQGFLLLKACFRVLGIHKQLLLFPLLSFFICLVLASSYRHFLPYPPYTHQWIFLAFVLVILFLCDIVVVFFNCALIASSIAYFQKKTVSITTGFSAAFRCFWQIAAWTLWNMTIGVLFRMINLRSLVGTFAGINRPTLYLATPLIVLEKLNPSSAIKRARYLLQNTWGTDMQGSYSHYALLGYNRVNFIFSISKIIAILPAIIGIYWNGSHNQMAGIIISFVLLFVLSLFQMMMNNILRCALYQYAIDKNVMPPFNAAAVQNAFRASLDPQNEIR